jgi:hypothetical protein
MIKRFKVFIATLMLAVIALPMVAAVPAMAVSGAPPAPSCDSSFLTLPSWHRGVVYHDGTDCKIKQVTETGSGTNEITLTSFVWTVVLNIIEMALHAIGYIATFFIIYGGFQFFTAGGSPDAVAKARKTILNAVIGLVISIASVGIVNFIMGIIG